MTKILYFSWVTIAMLAIIVFVSISVIQSNSKEIKKIFILAIFHFLIYCLVQYSCGFIQWTIRFNKFDSYPYKNPFCILVIIYCIISFSILGTCYIRYGKNKYGITKTIWFWFVIHILALLFLMIFSPFNGWF